jgi:hypothetical protein
MLRHFWIRVHFGNIVGSTETEQERGYTRSGTILFYFLGMCGPGHILTNLFSLAVMIRNHHSSDLILSFTDPCRLSRLGWGFPAS